MVAPLVVLVRVAPNKLGNQDLTHKEGVEADQNQAALHKQQRKQKKDSSHGML